MTWPVPRPGDVLLAGSETKLSRFEELQFEIDPPAPGDDGVAERLRGAEGWVRVFGDPSPELQAAVDAGQALLLRCESRVMRLEVTVTVAGEAMPFFLHEMGLMMTQLPFTVGDVGAVELQAR